MFTVITDKVDFMEEIWPFQWRFVICALASLIAASLTMPIVFATQGPIVAGKLGMSLSVASAIIPVSMVWINTKVPIFCNLVALKEYEVLDTLFNKTVKYSAIITLFISSCLLCIIILVYHLFPSLSVKLADPIVVMILIISAISSLPNLTASTYLRAHKLEVTMIANMTVAIATVCTIYLAAQIGNLFHIALIMSVGNVALSVWVYILFKKYKKEWHKN
jgi:O-antigen/teichoic acid export membrane protein